MRPGRVSGSWLADRVAGLLRQCPVAPHAWRSRRPCAMMGLGPSRPRRAGARATRGAAMDPVGLRTPTDATLARAAELAREFVATLPDRPVHATATLEELRSRFGGPLPDEGVDPVAVVEALADNARDGLVASAGPRYFGFVIGGGLPAAVGADWLATAWDQNAGLYVIGPAAAVAEEVAGAWAAELFGLPAGVSVGFTTGATMASFTGLAAGRHALLERAGWDVERQGLYGAPGAARRRERRVARHDLRRAPDAGPGARPGDPRADGRPGSDAFRRPWSRRCRRSGSLRSSAPRPATSTPAPSTRCRRSSRPSARTAAGSTWTVRSGCGPAPTPHGGTWSRASAWPTRGRRTPTSGSTSRTTRGCPSSRTRRRTRRR